MPYPNEVASGESLIWLENSQALKDFKGVMRKQEHVAFNPPKLEIQRNDWCPRRVIAIDGSNITEKFDNGFPGAEAGLVMISVILIDLECLRDIKPDEIPHPKVFRDMEKARTVQAAVPGIGVTHKDVENDSPVNYFRRTIKETFEGHVVDNHETLLETLHYLTQNENFNPKAECPECGTRYNKGSNKCNNCNGELYPTDLLRLHEYFEEIGSCESAHARFRSALEIIILLNILRFFAKQCPAYLSDCAFVLDGPLAIFGTPASILRPVRAELLRLNEVARKANDGKDIVLLGVEKTGSYCDHWEQIDWDKQQGQRTKYPPKTIITPCGKYVRENIVPGSDKPHGADTHFGRYVLYKTDKGEHVVINTGMLNEKSQNFSIADEECYPRLGDILNVMDQLASYLYRDGFMPLISAHKHAAIPLKRGTDIIRSLMEEE